MHLIKHLKKVPAANVLRVCSDVLQMYYKKLHLQSDIYWRNKIQVQHNLLQFPYQPERINNVC